MAGEQNQNRAFSAAWSRKWSFLAVFLLVFFTSTGVLAALDLLPEAGSAMQDTRTLVAGLGSVDVEEQLPTLIEIPEIGLKATIENPTSTNVAALDEALLSGAVRYPTSAELGEEGNVILFGHSSYLPIVNNQAFKAFNGIQDLAEGDQILVTGSSQVFVYEVVSVRAADAEEDAIPLTAEGYTLTLATCDSFGHKSDRFIVTAELAGTYEL